MKRAFPVGKILRFLEKEEDFVFLETAKADAQNYLSYLFFRPRETVSTFKINEVEESFAKLNQALKKGYYVAGFLSYEAGEAFEERLRQRKAFDFPLLWFGIYEEPLIYHRLRGEFLKCSAKADSLIQEISSAADRQGRHYSLKNIRPNISENAYLKSIAKIKSLIAQGFTYQVNYTFKLKFSFSGSAEDLYLDLRKNQSVSYAAFIKAHSGFKKERQPFYILSFSPELFFRKSGNKICARPMKGTAKRGYDLREDTEIAAQLKDCPKNRSENLMIVDLLRNDLGRISTTGSVGVPRLFNVEKYETLFQMTSDIESKLQPGVSAFDIFKHIFPSGSVTGAPKIRTMQIIRQLEKEPRNVYTGSIGFFSPQKTAAFNVAIRTILIDSQSKTAEMGVGSGIVYDSEARKEYAECNLKANFLLKKPQDFALIETMLWHPLHGYLLLDEHLARLKNSAGYFDFVFRKKEILTALSGLKRHFKKSAYRVRLFLNKDGKIRLESSLWNKAAAKMPKVCFSRKKTDSKDLFLYHKTTNRKFYDAEYKKCRREGFYDVLFRNEKGEITEGAISNIFVKKNGKFYTPPLKCGLLNGVYRRYLLDSQNGVIEEKPLLFKDIINAEEIYLSNSVRGLVRVQLERKDH